MGKRDVEQQSAKESSWLVATPRRATACGAISCFLLWLALPPVDWSFLAWLAPVGWLLLINDPRVTGRRFYATQWLLSWAFWLALLHGVRLAHPALYLGWMALSAYLAVFAPLFVAMTRWAVHRARVPLVIAAPLTWVMLELFRAHFLTGFAGGMLGHALVFWTPLIQMSDLGGAYLVSALVMLVATCVVQMVTGREQTGVVAPPRWLLGAVAVCAIGAAWGYGAWRMAPQSGQSDKRPLRVALVQDSIDTIFEFNEERNRMTFEKYRRATLEACRQTPGIDLVVWPESMFTENSPEWLVDDEILRERLAPRIRGFEDKAATLIEEIQAVQKRDGETEGGAPGTTWLLAGTLTIDTTRQQRPPAEYNAALLIDPRGRIAGRYYKRHLVMFGEYIPLGRQFPWLYQLVGMGAATPGAGPVALDVKGWNVSPNICFETMVPQEIRRQVHQLRHDGHPADVLVNLTNDGWFWGSTILDMHFRAGVFRAVEARRPLLVAANTGITTSIDGAGRVLAEVPRRAPHVVVVDVVGDDRVSLYERFGDLPLALVTAISWGAIAVLGRRRKAA